MFAVRHQKSVKTAQFNFYTVVRKNVLLLFFE